jgi:cystathionine beta-lyase
MPKTLRPDTLCVHAGAYVDEKVGGVNTPIYASSSFMDPNPQGGQVHYPRYSDIPTQAACADKIAALEDPSGRAKGWVTASGMAAVSAPLLALLAPGDHAVFQADLYGGTHHFVHAELRRLGVELTMVPETDPEAIAAAVTDATRVVYLESPTNPTLRVIDLAATARAVRKRNPDAALVIDNTFATPMNQRPLALGFHVVVHSGTKYLGGHSDLSCGAVVALPRFFERIRDTAVSLGATLNVLDCYLLERSMKTLHLRMARHNANAQAAAEFLERHPGVSLVNYPGLPGHHGHRKARNQMAGYGGIVSFEVPGGKDAAEALMARLRLVVPAVSLGGVESLICLPARTSHAKMPPEERAAIGVTDGLLRLSCGVEDPADIVADLQRALEG